MSADSPSALRGTPRLRQRSPQQSPSQSLVSPSTDSIMPDTEVVPQYSPQPTLSPVLPSAQNGDARLEWTETGRQPQDSGLFPWIQAQFHHIVSDQVTPLRLAGHLSVLVVAATILLLSQVEIPKWELPIQAAGTAVTDQANSANRAQFQLATSQLGNDALQRAAVPFTIIQERGRQTIDVYSVASGDTVLGIAEKFGLQPETIQWSNPSIEQNPDLLRIGDTLKIPPTDGVLHTVAPGDTLSTLADKYKVSVDAITTFGLNDIEGAETALTTGKELFIPGGTKPFIAKTVVAYSGPIPTNAAKGTGSFGWPASGSVTQRYWGGHPAIDVGSWTGSPVKASDSGYVVVSGGGWNGGYGNHVIIDHGNGFVTLYAHLNSIFVRAGESVSRGQQIGTVGNTGNSTGPHLHFEVRYQGAPQNPFSYLP